MNRIDFMSKAYKAIQSFETRWNKGQRSEGEENWPNSLPEPDWWEQLIVHIEQESENEQ